MAEDPKNPTSGIRLQGDGVVPKKETNARGKPVPHPGALRNPAANKPAFSGKPQRSGMKPIHDMAEHSHQLPTDFGANQPIAHVMSDNYVGRRRWIKWGVSVTIMVGFVAALVWVPGLAEKVKRYAKQGYAKVEQAFDDDAKLTAKKVKKRRVRSQQRPRVEKGTQRPAKSAANERFFDNPSCARIVNTPLGSTDYRRMGRSEKILVAECFLLYGQATSAEATIAGFESSLRKAGEKQINKDSAPGGLGDALFAVLDIHLVKTNYRAADALLTRQCRVWRRSNSCIAKLMTLVARKFTNAASSAYKQMVLQGEKINKSAYARYYLAGAQIASQKGQLSAASKRYRQALADAPTQSHWLRKRIYESFGVELYRRGEMLELKKLMTKALREFRGVDTSAQIKLLLLADLVKPSTRPDAVKRFLFSQDRAYQTRGDLELLEILATEAILYRHEKIYLTTLKRAKVFFATKYQASKQIMKQLQLWEIRCRISQKEYELTFQSLGQYEQEYGKDSVSQHLRGITYMAFSPNQQYQLLAAKELQGSLRKGSSWEGLYALGAALIRGGKITSVAPVLKEMLGKTTQAYQRYWFDMLQAEYLVVGRNHPEALKILQRWRIREPNFITPALLMEQSYKAQGRQDLARKVDLELDVLRARVKTAESKEGRTSPLGPFALTSRPLD